MGKKKRKDKSQVNVITAVLRLLKKKMPALLVWQSKGRVMKIGSENLCKWYDELEPGLKSDLRGRMVQDIVSMNKSVSGKSY